MKKKIVFIGLVTFMFFSLSACSKSFRELSTEEVQGFLQKISNSPFGLEIKADNAHITSEPAKNGRYRVFLKNPDISFSTEIYKHLNIPFPVFKIPVKTEEMVFIYGPDEDYCELLSAAGLDFSLNMKEFVQKMELEEEKKDIEKIPEMDFTFTIGNITFKNYNLSPLLDTANQDFIEVLANLLDSNQPLGILVDDVKFGFNMVQKEGKYSMAGSIENAESLTTFAPEVLIAFTKQEESGTLFSRLLEDGQSPIEVKSVMENMEMSLNTIKGDINAGLENMGVVYYLRPTSGKDAFKFGYDLNIGAFKVTSPELKKVETFADLTKMNLNFSIEGLSPEFFQTYMDIIKTSQRLSATKDPALGQQMAMKGQALVRNLIQSKPVISLSLSPLDHKLGRIEAEGKFQFIQMGPPVGKATVKIFNVQEMGQKLKAKELFPSETIDTAMAKIQDIFEIDQNGDGLLIFEIKKEDPANFYLNGKPQSFGGANK